MIKCSDKGFSKCYNCNFLSLKSLLFRIKFDNYEHLYCYLCAINLEKGEKNK